MREPIAGGETAEATDFKSHPHARTFVRRLREESQRELMLLLAAAEKSSDSAVATRAVRYQELIRVADYFGGSRE